MNAFKVGISVAVSTAFLQSTASASTTLYNQTYVPGLFRASQNDPVAFGSFALAYDNFTLVNSANITGIAWVGEYFNPETPAPISEFTLVFYASMAGAPGPMLSSVTINGTSNETLVSGVTHTYSATLPGPGFTASGSTEYWVSIQATLGFPPQWGWGGGVGGDGQSFQDFLGSGSAVPTDLAFSLTGDLVSAIPEPSGVISLAGLLSAGLLFRSRSRAR